MKHRCYNLNELAAIHKSLVDLYGMQEHIAMGLIYHLNTANIDTMRYLYGTRLYSSGPINFYYEINRRGRSLRSITRLARALEDLLENITVSALTCEQRLAVRRAEAIVDSLYDRIESGGDVLMEKLLRALVADI